MQTFSVVADFSSTDRAVKLVADLRSKDAARDWVVAFAPRDPDRVQKIDILDDIDGSVETVWNREWSPDSNIAGLYGIVRAR